MWHDVQTNLAAFPRYLIRQKLIMSVSEPESLSVQVRVDECHQAPT